MVKEVGRIVELLKYKDIRDYLLLNGYVVMDIESYNKELDEKYEQGWNEGFSDGWSEGSLCVTGGN